ncbi:MAG: hypothetical protein IH622_24995 [Ochrobactrum anthropi]|uniref:Uncharacterized protein n=1 Tax=Brucella anthropi TaxID=529 RepID=A0A8I0N9I9_BRUAN|nr:hypothetical protein [Brucella anthropi]MBE0564047.1 hypothetical protein [Brucella anthropi]
MRHKLFALAITAVLAITGATAANAAFDNPNKITVQDASGKEIGTFSIAQLKAEFSQQTYNTRTPWTQKDGKIAGSVAKLSSGNRNSGNDPSLMRQR